MARVKTTVRSELSEEVIDDLAREAEVGYELGKARRVRLGRPGMGKAGASPRVQVRVDPGLAGALRSRAREEKRSISEVARTALRQYIQRTS